MYTIFGQKKISLTRPHSSEQRSIYFNITWTVWSLPDEWKFGMVVKSEFEQSARRNPEDHLQVQDEGHEDMKSARTRDSPTPYKQRRVNIGLCIFVEGCLSKWIWQLSRYSTFLFVHLQLISYFISNCNLIHIYNK